MSGDKLKRGFFCGIKSNNNNMEATTNTVTVRQAILKAFNQMPDTFSAIKLCALARAISGKQTMDGTQLRRLRELRNDGICDYKVIDPSKASYQKIQK